MPVLLAESCAEEVPGEDRLRTECGTSGKAFQAQSGSVLPAYARRATGRFLEPGAASSLAFHSAAGFFCEIRREETPFIIGPGRGAGEAGLTVPLAPQGAPWEAGRADSTAPSPSHSAAARPLSTRSTWWPLTQNTWSPLIPKNFSRNAELSFTPGRPASRGTLWI